MELPHTVSLTARVLIKLRFGLSDLQSGAQRFCIRSAVKQKPMFQTNFVTVYGREVTERSNSFPGTG